MKKMIDQEKINKSDALFEGMTADENGNVTIGKNLEVDGEVIINTATDLKTKDGTYFGGGEGIINVYRKENTDPKTFTALKDGTGVVALYDQPYINSNKKEFYGLEGGQKEVYTDDTNNKKYLYANAANIYEGGDSYNFYLTKEYISLKIYEDGEVKYNAGDTSKNIIHYSVDDETLKFYQGHNVYTCYVIKRINTTTTPKILQCVNSKMSWVEPPTEKQYFNHDVQIIFNNSPLLLSIITTSNTPIDSVTDLKTACGSRTRIPMSGGFAGIGSVIQFACAYLPQENKLQLYSGNTASIGETTVLLATGDGNTLGAITDDVTPL